MMMKGCRLTIAAWFGLMAELKHTTPATASTAAITTITRSVSGTVRYTPTLVMASNGIATRAA